MNSAIIIEDQRILRELIYKVLGNFPFLKVIATTGDGAEGYNLCLQHNPDFIVLDIMLPSLNGVEILRRLKAEKPQSNILVFSGIQSPDLVKQIMETGINGYIEKDAGLEELEKAIRLVANGETYFGTRVMEAVREIMFNPREDGSLESLTSREREIIQLVAESHSTKKIAAKLNISAKTADTHRANIMKKLDIHDVAGLTRFAIYNRLIGTPEVVQTNTS